MNRIIPVLILNTVHITAYQNFWDAETETLLQQLDAPQSLEDNTKFNGDILEVP